MYEASRASLVRPATDSFLPFQTHSRARQNFAAARRPPQYVFAVEPAAARGAAEEGIGSGAGTGTGPSASASATNRYFQALSEHCNAGSFQYACPPLVLHGPPGVGKSAILSNWLGQQRTAAREEAGLLPSPGALPCLTRREFVFWHAAGCSRTSCLTTHLLRRLQTELRAFFELKKEVSTDDERLRWDLPTFLELAARKVLNGRWGHDVFAFEMRTLKLTSQSCYRPLPPPTHRGRCSSSSTACTACGTRTAART